MEIQDLYASSARLVRGIDTNFKRYLYDAIDWNVRMLCIRGAKGVGKTTMMLQYIKEHFPKTSSALYVTLDDLWFSNNRLIDLVDYHYSHGGTHLFIDEVHRYPFLSWSTELKNAYDKYPSLHIVFSGLRMRGWGCLYTVSTRIHRVFWSWPRTMRLSWILPNSSSSIRSSAGMWLSYGVT